MRKITESLSKKGYYEGTYKPYFYANKYEIGFAEKHECNSNSCSPDQFNNLELTCNVSYLTIQDQKIVLKRIESEIEELFSAKNYSEDYVGCTLKGLWHDDMQFDWYDISNKVQDLMSGY